MPFICPDLDDKEPLDEEELDDIKYHERVDDRLTEGKGA
jgi:hypothetical protein